MKRAMERAKKVWKEHRRLTIAAIVAAVVLIAGAAVLAYELL